MDIDKYWHVNSNKIKRDSSQIPMENPHRTMGLDSQTISFKEVMYLPPMRDASSLGSVTLINTFNSYTKPLFFEWTFLIVLRA